MAVLGKLITDLLLSAGINPEAEEIKDKIAPILVLDNEIPDNVASTLKTNLMTEESAKNNQVLKNYFKAQSLNGMDTTLNSYVDGYEGFDDAIKADFKAETSTFKRTTMILDKLKELEGAKHGEGTTEADKKKMDSLRTQIGELNGKVATANEGWEAKEKAIRDESQSQVMEYAYKAALSGKPYVNKEVDADVNILFARNLVDNQLKKDGAMIKFSDGEFKLVQIADPELDYMQESKKVAFGDYANSVLTQNKIIEVSNGGTPPPTTPNIVSPATPPAGGQPDYQEGLAMLNEQLQGAE